MITWPGTQAGCWWQGWPGKPSSVPATGSRCRSMLQSAGRWGQAAQGTIGFVVTPRRKQAWLVQLKTAAQLPSICPAGPSAAITPAHIHTGHCRLQYTCIERLTESTCSSHLWGFQGEPQKVGRVKRGLAGRHGAQGLEGGAQACDCRWCRGAGSMQKGTLHFCLAGRRHDVGRSEAGQGSSRGYAHTHAVRLWPCNIPACPLPSISAATAHAPAAVSMR